MSGGSQPESGAVLRVLPDDPEYRRMADAEAAFWATTQTFGCEAQEAVAGATPIDRHDNKRLTGDPKTLWYETISRYGNFRRGLAVGTSGTKQDGRILDLNPDLHMTFYDISAQALQRWERELGTRYPGRIATRVADLNFVELPPSAFDVVISSASVHHITNLEHLAVQVNRALTPDGYFFLCDYVGETRFRFSDEKKRLFELLYNRDIARHRGGKPGLVWRNEADEDRSPFCGVRSGDILDVFRQCLTEVEVRTSGAVVGPLLFARPAGPAAAAVPGPVRVLRALRRRAIARLFPAARTQLSRAYLRELMLADSIACDAGLLVPQTAFAVYRKRG